MKCCLLIVIFVLTLCGTSSSQLPYGAPNVTRGNVSCLITQTQTEIQGGVTVSKCVTEIRFSTKILMSFSYNQSDLDVLKAEAESWGRLPQIATGSNYSRPFNEDESWTSEVPRFETTLSYKADTWTTDPCQAGNEELVLSTHEEGTGHMQDPLRGVVLGLEGMRDDLSCYIVRIFSEGGWGNIRDIAVTSRVYKPDPSDPDYKCRWQDLEGEMYFMLNAPVLNRILLTGTDLPEGYSGSYGIYNAVEDHSYEGLMTTYHHEFYKIDTGDIFSYLREMPPGKQFRMEGHYRKTTRDTQSGNVTEFTEASSLTLTLGELINKMALSTAVADDYHKWLPFRKDEAGYMPLTVKAEIISDDPDPSDMVYLTLKDVSHLPGYCTNYPVSAATALTDTGADIRFASVQRDPNVEYLDTFNVRTKTKVSSVTVDLECYDYGGSARLEAWSVNKNLEGISVYDDRPSLQIPEDGNQNLVADAWEQATGIYERNLTFKDDSDRYPEGQADQGDGYSLFEEYRGFFAEKDFCRGTKGNIRSGKFVRTDPHWKDVFIHDATGQVFESQFSPSNPADLNWHMVSKEQVRMVSAEKINSMLLHAEKDENGDVIDLQSICDILRENDHRRINCNTPERCRIAEHYGMFLLYSERLNGTMTVGMVARQNDVLSTVKGSHFIEIQQFEPYRDRVLKNCPDWATCPNETCTYEGMADGGETCPLCGAALAFRPFYDEAGMLQIAGLTYEGAVIHEIGHNLTSTRHHENGMARFTDAHGTEFAISGENLASMPFSQEDKDRALTGLAALGVLECAMKYNFQRNEEFTSGSLLKIRTNRYCRKGETYIDDYQNIRPADNCYGEISVR